jgi:hypothetical protein
MVIGSYAKYLPEALPKTVQFGRFKRASTFASTK